MAVISASLLAAAGFLLSFLNGRTNPYIFLDIEVYRLGAQVWISGGDLYGSLPTTSAGLDLPFTYPPIAAALFSPAALAPLWMAGAVLTVLSVTMLGGVIALVLGSLGTPRRLAEVGMLLPAAILLEPVWSTVSYGQINVLLMALVVLDCLVKTPRWPRGALIGLAAAVKLTPAAFVLFLLLRRDYRAVGTAVLSFLAATALGVLLAWSDSVRFWTATLYESDRIGAVHYAGNQSMLAVLARFGVEPPGRTVLWLVLVILVVGTAVIGMRRALAAGLPGLALGVNALAAMLASPVSWSHHWVWSVPLLLSLAVIGWRARAWLPASLASVGVLLFAASPQWWFPATENREYGWDLGQQLLGSSYVYFAVLVLIVAAGRAWPVGQVRHDRPKFCPIGHLWSHRRERH